VCVNDIAAQSDAVGLVVAEIHALGANAVGVIADVTVLAEVEDLVRRAVEAHGPLHLMVANAGVIQAKALLDVTQDDWDWVFNVNAKGMFNSYTAAARAMIEQGHGGKIVGAAR
jgi:meso-butanediol dehydrogenase/(S,S)-butanediol dehydrogenase/diacetyl reductase